MHTATLIFYGLASLAQGAALITQADINQCLAASGIPYDAWGSDDWNRDSTAYNLRVPYTPAAFSVAQTINHIKEAVLCGKKLNIKVSGRAGGHSYASFGLGGDNSHLVIELSQIYGVSFNNETKVATVERGARLGHMATILYEDYNRAIPHGTCPG